MPLSRLAQQPLAHQANDALLEIAPAAVLVGGAVRDLLLNLPVQDLDYAIPGDAIPVARRLADAMGGAFFVLDEERGTGRVILGGRDEAQKPVVDLVSLREGGLDDDLRARDFTVNAIAIRADGAIYDPLDGATDLHERLLRTCTPSSLLDDPVRVLRAVRFQLGFDLQPAAGLATQARAASARLAQVSPERRRDEFVKLLALNSPELALQQLDAWQALPVLMPELLALKGISQPSLHVYDVYEHTLAALAAMARIDRLIRNLQIPEDPFEQAVALALTDFQPDLQSYLEQPLSADRPRWLWLRFAALAHDWGKPATASRKEGVIHFYDHESVSAELAAAWLRGHHCAGSVIEFVTTICQGHMRPIHLGNAAQPLSRRSLYRFYRALDSCAVAVSLFYLADTAATFGPEISPDNLQASLDLTRQLLAPAFQHENQPILPQPLLNGHDLISHFNLEPGPQIGQLLEALREAQATGTIESRQQAFDFIEQQLQSPGPIST
ncbi:MAG: CCA tRNA nucleotidyltransferase [Caldilineales bacterium]|nr:CCA tRNA nucleotidyltransferase [Caldilineales bacterium]